MRLLYRYKKAVSGGYGLLYNWFATQEQPTVEYGYLYNWWAATDARGICSTGWHVPTRTEVNTLISYLGGSTVSGGKLKETGTIYWNSPNTGATNETSFNGRGSGERNSTGAFILFKVLFSMLTSTPLADRCYGTRLEASTDDNTETLYFKYAGQCIRLLKDSTTLSDGQTGIYIGNDGKVYQTICIGTQEWLASNLTETKYANGDWIHGFDGGTYTPISNAAWVALTTEAMCSYNDTVSNAYSTTKITSSDDWAVPSDSDLQDLFDYLGGTSVAGGKLKEIGTIHWNSPNTGATNEALFNGRGSGDRGNTAGYVNLKIYLQLWSSTEALEDINAAYVRFISYDNESVGRYYNTKVDGFSLRLCNTTTTNAEGSVNSYTQNNGQVIPTIVINGVEWTMNLTETKLRDGSWIHGYEGGVYTPISNAAWASLTTAGLCAYNDDTLNI